MMKNIQSILNARFSVVFIISIVLFSGSLFAVSYDNTQDFFSDSVLSSNETNHSEQYNDNFDSLDTEIDSLSSYETDGFSSGMDPYYDAEGNLHSEEALEQNFQSYYSKLYSEEPMQEPIVNKAVKTKPRTKIGKNNQENETQLESSPQPDSNKSVKQPVDKTILANKSRHEERKRHSRLRNQEQQ